MSKTLAGTYSIGYTLSGATQGVLNPVTVTGSIDSGGAIPAALYAQGPNAWTVTNRGTISGGIAAGIDLAAGGTVTNDTTGYLGGHLGIAVQGAAGSVTNSGTIRAINAGSSAAANQAAGIILTAGGSVFNQVNALITGQGAGIDILSGAGTVVNAGVISGPAYEGVYLDHGLVTNLASGIISGGSIAGGGSIGAGGSIVTSGWGIAIRNGGTLFNAGVVTGTGQGGAFLGGGTATNQGTMSGVWGVAMTGAAGTVINSGSLNGSGQSAVFLTGGNVSNTSGGRITGISGVVIRNAPGTVVNGGFIGAASLNGYGVYLAPGFTNRLSAIPGAVFSGLVNGGNAAGATAVSTLELTSAASQGSLSGLGTQFINFSQTVLDAGASWSLTGQNSIAPGASLSNAGTLAIDGALVVRGAFGGAGAVTIAGAASVVGSATIGAGGVWSGGSGLTVGASGAGSLLVNNNGSADVTAAMFGANAGGTGGLDVNGARFSNTGLITLGLAGTGRMVVENLGTVLSGGTAAPGTGIELGFASGGAGDMTVTGAASLLNNAGRFVVGDAGRGVLSVLAGGTVLTSPGTVAGLSGAVIGNTASASGSSVNVSGTGSNLRIDGTLVVGNGGFGSLSITQGGTVTAAALDDAAGAGGGGGAIVVSGAGSALTLTGTMVIGDNASGGLSVLAGAIVTGSGNLRLGNAAGSSGNIDIEGVGSQLILNTTTVAGVVSGGILNVGGVGGGKGVITLGVGATLTVGKTISVGANGVLNNLGGTIDPDVLTPNGVGLGLNLAGVSVNNTGTVTISNGSGTWNTPLVQTGSDAASAAANIADVEAGNISPGLWVIGALGTLVMNTNTVDAGQVVQFNANTATLVIGQEVVGGIGVDPTISAGAANVLPHFQASIWGYRSGDQILFNNLNVASDAIVNGNTINLFDAGNTLLGSLGFFSGTGGNISAANLTAAKNQLACFAAGTRIATADGPVAVEHLCLGESVTLHGGGYAQVVWVGSRAVDCGAHPDPGAVWPVRVTAEAFGPRRPGRDLYLSPDHAVFVNGVLVPVKLLINGTSIVQEKRAKVTYYHVELPEHAVILAEGLTVESYLDTGDRTNFQRDRGVVRLFPDFTAQPAMGLVAIWETRGAAHLVMAGEALNAARALVRAYERHPPSGQMDGGRRAGNQSMIGTG